eukprot:scaffold2859_cov349-Pavlova_lutheri.AAC.65
MPRSRSTRLATVRVGIAVWASTPGPIRERKLGHEFPAKEVHARLSGVYVRRWKLRASLPGPWRNWEGNLGRVMDRIWTVV